LIALSPRGQLVTLTLFRAQSCLHPGGASCHGHVKLRQRHRWFSLTRLGCGRHVAQVGRDCTGGRQTAHCSTVCTVFVCYCDWRGHAIYSTCVDTPNTRHHRCYTALGDIATAEYLSKLLRIAEQNPAGVNHFMVRAKLGTALAFASAFEYRKVNVLNLWCS